MTQIWPLALLFLAACSTPQAAPPRAAAAAPAASPKPRLTPAGMPLGGDDCAGNGAGSCAKGLTCFPLDSLPNGRGVCAVEATIEELATRTRYERALVGVRHVSFGSPTVCTDMACDCCNSCTRRTTISDGTENTVIAARSSGEPYLIKADQCAIKTLSSGLPSGPHTIVGIVRRTGPEGPSLQIRHLISE
ncbi:MAG TPA: hypothetical protein VEX18_11205 [Polyangiaceae bacterium]|nr:hypothetical protein [Polyangiaceae bacterium]